LVSLLANEAHCAVGVLQVTERRLRMQTDSANSSFGLGDEGRNSPSSRFSCMRGSIKARRSIL
jgi:hypothetical protein